MPKDLLLEPSPATCPYIYLPNCCRMLAARRMDILRLMNIWPNRHWPDLVHGSRYNFPLFSFYHGIEPIDRRLPEDDLYTAVHRGSCFNYSNCGLAGGFFSVSHQYD